MLSRNLDPWEGGWASLGHWVRVLRGPTGQGPRRSLAYPGFKGLRQGGDRLSGMGQGVLLGRCRREDQDMGSGKLKSLPVAAPFWTSVSPLDILQQEASLLEPSVNVR